jgi:hypothetical protein
MADVLPRLEKFWLKHQHSCRPRLHSLGWRVLSEKTETGEACFFCLHTLVHLDLAGTAHTQILSNALPWGRRPYIYAQIDIRRTLTPGG